MNKLSGPIEQGAISGLNIPQQESENSLDLTEYWALLMRHKYGLILFAALGAAFGYWIAETKLPQYYAQATLIVEPEFSNPAAIQPSFQAYYSWQYQGTQFGILRSETMAKRVAENMDPEQREFLIARKETNPLLLLVDNMTTWLKGLAGIESTVPDVNSLDSTISTDLEPVDEGRMDLYAGSIRGGLNVKRDQDSQILTVSYTSHNPFMAADVPNTLADTYIGYLKETRLERTRRAGTWLAEQLKELRGRLAQSENALLEFQAEHGMSDLETFQETKSARLETLNNEVIRAQAEVDELSKRYGARHPNMVAATQKLGNARARLNRESRTAVSTTQLQFELNKLENEVNSNRELYEVFQARFNETDFSTDENLTNARVLDYADVPGGPFSPNKPKIIGMWAFIGLFIGVVLAWLREHLDVTIKNHEQLETKTGVPVLGVVPLITNEDKKAAKKTRRRILGTTLPERYYVANNQSSFSESVNHIRTNILYSRVDAPFRSVLISSALQSEGKTTLSTNLALAFSQLGTTLLVDADLRKPRVAKVTGLSRSVGLVECVAGRAELKDVVVPDPHSEQLSILRAGAIPPNPLELISSNRMIELMERIRGEYEYVVVDSAPILPVSDAIVLSQMVDCMLLVVKAVETSHVAVSESIKRLSAMNAPLIGTVLTQIDQRRSYYHYGKSRYYSGYHQYAYAYAYGSKKKK